MLRELEEFQLSPAFAPTRWRRLLIAALLPAEILLITLAYDPSPQASVLVDIAYGLMHMPVAVAGTLILILSLRLTELRRKYGVDSRPHSALRTLMQVAFYAAFFVQTDILLTTVGTPSAAFAAVLWAMLGLAVGVSWAIALAPPTIWRRFATNERATLGASLLAGIAVWAFALVAQKLWRPLAESTLYFSQILLASAYPDVTYDAAELTFGTRRFMVEIAPQCSGYEGLGLVSVFVAIYLWLFRARIALPRAYWLFPAGLAAMWVANVVRISLLIAVGSSISPTIAVQGFHSQAGWLAFTTVALGLIWLSHRAGLVSRDSAATVTPSAAPPYLVPFIAMLAASMMTVAFSAGFDLLYPLGVMVTAAVLWHYRRAYRSITMDVSPVAVALGGAVFVVWVALEPRSANAQVAAPAAIADLPFGLVAVWIAFRVVGAVVTVPIAEELAFRGYLLRKLVARDFEQVPYTTFTLWSCLGSSILFGLLHESWLAGTLAGITFAAALHHRGRLFDAIVAHMTANALIAASVFGLGWWHLWL